ncbi:MAG: hypothetical protein KDA61_21230, partial [Planctomycetales bacterium]|nr:hypothetical protein [Planctomycetales bacterium]
RRDADPSKSPAQFIDQQLQRAQQLADQGELLQAREVLQSVISLYLNNRELESRVAEAQRRLDDLDRP